MYPTMHMDTHVRMHAPAPDEKVGIIARYKNKLGSIDCRHFARGDGSCPFGTSCFYRHAYPGVNGCGGCCPTCTVSNEQALFLQTLAIAPGCGLSLRTSAWHRHNHWL